MRLQQYTIQHKVHFEGVGLHTGIWVKATLLPMSVDTGIRFQRVDLPHQPIVEAMTANVVATARSTVLAKEQVRVATVEHLLAAVVGLQIDNLCIQLDGPEVPDLDGSACAFVQLLAPLVSPQEAQRKFWCIKEKFVYHDPNTGSHFEVYPDDDYRLHCTIAYDRWPLAYQYASLDRLDQFQAEVAPARTFCYLDEIATLYRKGLLQGGDPTKALVLYDKGDCAKLIQEVKQLSGKKITQLVLPDQTTALRYPNEPARHKLLDLMGDLALLRRPLQGKIFAHKPGHGANVRFAMALERLLVRQEAKNVPRYEAHVHPLLDVQQISKMLPHRYPFQLVDKVMQLDEVAIVAIKQVTINEPFFQGHFPGIPVMPGVLQVEALAQTGGILVLHKLPDPEAYLTYFLSIDRCKFRRVIVPGDTLVLQCQLLTPIKFTTTEAQSVGIAKVQGRIFVGAHLSCEAVLLAQIVKRHEKSVC